MRRDILEFDATMPRVVQNLNLTLEDVESIRLVLSGGSVVDWQRLAFDDLAEVNRYLALHLLDMDDPVDRERLRYVFNEAVSYLEEHMKLVFPSEVRNPVDVRDIFLFASQMEGFRRKQILSCAILKLMHVIHHMEAADLKFKATISEEHLFDLAEASILRHARSMRDAGLPIVSFYGSRKSRNSVITKLLAKKDTIAATIFDKLRFRIVVEQHADLLPTLAYMTRNMFPFNYVIPGQTHNNLLDPNVVVRHLDSDAGLPQRLRDTPERATTGKNEFSGESYRMVNFIVDYPVRLPDPPGQFAFEFGRVVFLMIEFQILDEDTVRRNADGENAHHLYKQRQRRVVAQRLKRGRYPKKTS